MHRETIPEPTQGPFRLDRCGDLSLLRRTLEAAGYVESAVAQTVMMDESGKPTDFSAVVRRTAEPSPYNTLVRLFVLASAVPQEAARAALAPLPLEELADIGLLVQSGQEVQAAAAVMPFEDLLLVRDVWPDFTTRPVPHDHVPGVGPASVAVVNLTVRRSVERALDLGTGLGVQALRASRHAKRVIGTDTNPRALNFAALNARLNGVTNLELRGGSVYEPVSDCRFDLIVSNPPFVISPQSHYEYRDSGLPGDTISERVIRGAAPLLCEGGYCTVLFNWHHKTESDWSERPAAWLRSSGCDAWLLCSNHADPLDYAAGWLRSAAGDDADRYARFMDEWLEYYERLGIGRISTGAIIMRRQSGRPNWFRAEDAPPGPSCGSCSDQIQRVFAACDLIEGLDDERDLLGKRFLLTPDHQLEQVLQAEGGKWTVRHTELKQVRGLQFAGKVDRLVSTVLAGCDGQHTLAELTGDLAASLRMDGDKIASASIAVIRTLLQSGFLTIAGD